MIFRATKLAGAYLIDLELHRDERGFFARSFCRDEFARAGLVEGWVQSSVSYNARRGTLRGMHWQIEPFAETKLVRCTAGAIFDVIVDLRDGSETRLQWTAAELTADNRRMLYVPEGFAHGFLTLADETEVFYEMSRAHVPDAARGLRWNDPAMAIDWPDEPSLLSDRDAGYPAWSSSAEGASRSETST